MRVLVTGGAGYIGSHTCKALAAAGHEPVAYDDLSMGHEWAVQWGPLVKGALADTALLQKTLRDHRIETVMHFAASSYVGESMQDPLKYFRNNIAGSISLFEAMQAAAVSRFVLSSTCAVYGLPETIPIVETLPSRPINPYGETKLAIENMARWLGETRGLRWIALRYFNAAGADPDAEIGESHEPETHLIPLALRAATPGRDDVLQVFGDDYDTPDGTAIRDYIHVQDLAQAHVLALRVLENNLINQHVNVGTGEGYSVRQVIDTVQAVTGQSVRLKQAPRRAGDPPRLVANADRAHKLLGWRPVMSDLHTIVKHAWCWEKKHRE